MKWSSFPHGVAHSVSPWELPLHTRSSAPNKLGQPRRPSTIRTLKITPTCNSHSNSGITSFCQILQIVHHFLHTSVCCFSRFKSRSYFSNFCHYETLLDSKTGF